MFEIGSITKVFTSLLLADSANRGLVKLDDSLAEVLTKKILKGEKLSNLSRDGQAITLRHLSQHTSGLPRLPDNLEMMDPEDPYGDYTLEKLLAYVKTVEPWRKPGSAYGYSNLGAGLLGSILALENEMSLDDLLRERVTAELKMSATTFDWKKLEDFPKTQGHLGVVPAKHWNMQSLAGAGSLKSNVEDLAKLLKLCLGTSDSALKKILEQTATPTSETSSPGLEIGLGWHVFRRQSGDIVWHNGGTGGYRTFMAYSDTLKRGVALLSNNALIDVDPIALHLLSAEFPSRIQQFPKHFKVPFKKLAACKGYYEAKDKSLVQVSIQADRMVINMLRTGNLLTLRAESARRFVHAEPAFALEFAFNDNGKVHGFDWIQGRQRVRYDRHLEGFQPPSTKEFPVPEKALKSYAGRYKISGGPILDVKVRKGKLTAKLGQQPRLFLRAESQRSFRYLQVDAVLEFQVSDKGQVTAVKLLQAGQIVDAKRQ